MRRLSIFGSTGSIGQNTMDLIRREPERFDVVALSGAGNIALLAAQAIEFRAQIAITALPDRLPELRDALAGSGVIAAAGADAIAEAAARPVDWGICAIVGAAGLRASMALAAQGRVLALANKESLVCAGDLLLATCAAHGTTLLPVDSEHSALFQSLGTEPRRAIRRLIITASGGPFKDWNLERMRNATLAQAVNHPKWDMGQRISIDSATLFNKALELIEAKVLFDVMPAQIEAVIHPQAIIHSMVEYVDSAIIAQLGTPDMRGAIGYALHWPERKPLPVAPLDFTTLSDLSFAAPDTTRFPALRLARRVMQDGGLSGAVLNAAKEAAMDAFIAGRAGFLQMAELVEYALDHPQLTYVTGAEQSDIQAVMQADSLARQVVNERIAKG